jgi:hypothetical protein
MELTPPQDAAMKRVLRLSLELASAQDDLTRLFPFYDDPELTAFEAEQARDRPRLRLIEGGADLAATA